MSPADAVKLFADQKITVQAAEGYLVKDEKSGKVAQRYKTKDEPLAAKHIHGEVKEAGGTVTITTIDGRKYSAKAGAK